LSRDGRDDLDGLVERLEEIAEELAERSLDDLREALDAGREPELERRLTRARRSVEKAAAILRELSGP
jgi:hypothetical protein